MLLQTSILTLGVCLAFALVQCLTAT